MTIRYLVLKLFYFHAFLPLLASLLPYCHATYCMAKYKLKHFQKEAVVIVEFIFYHFSNRFLITTESGPSLDESAITER
jgi:hypothetical protein